MNLSAMRSVSSRSVSYSSRMTSAGMPRSASSRPIRRKRRAAHDRLGAVGGQLDQAERHHPGRQLRGEFHAGELGRQVGERHRLGLLGCPRRRVVAEADDGSQALAAIHAVEQRLDSGQREPTFLQGGDEPQPAEVSRPVVADPAPALGRRQQAHVLVEADRRDHDRARAGQFVDRHRVGFHGHGLPLREICEERLCEYLLTRYTLADMALSVSATQKRLIGFIVVIAVVNIAYRLVYATGASQTAALYVGVPALLAIGLALLPRSGTSTGMLIKGSALAMLIAAVVLPEGLICLLFAMPLVAVIAIAVGVILDVTRGQRRRQGPTLMVVSLPLLLFSLEGVAGSPFATEDAVVVRSDGAGATPAEVAAALARPPGFDADLPLFLRAGFNRPLSATGSGIEVGDRRMIMFTGGTHDDHPLRLFGGTGERSVDHHSHMLLRVTESRPGRVVFTVDEDTTMLARWVDLDRAVVTWTTSDESTSATEVTWRLEYQPAPVSDRLLRTVAALRHGPGRRLPAGCGRHRPAPVTRGLR